jgi:hypothetical protein
MVNNWAVCWNEHATCQADKNISLILRDNSACLSNNFIVQTCSIKLL